MTEKEFWDIRFTLNNKLGVYTDEFRDWVEKFDELGKNIFVDSDVSQKECKFCGHNGLEWNTINRLVCKACQEVNDTKLDDDKEILEESIKSARERHLIGYPRM